MKEENRMNELLDSYHPAFGVLQMPGSVRRAVVFRRAGCKKIANRTSAPTGGAKKVEAPAVYIDRKTPQQARGLIVAFCYFLIFSFMCLPIYTALFMENSLYRRGSSGFSPASAFS